MTGATLHAVKWWKDGWCIRQRCGICRRFTANEMHTANVWLFRWLPFSSVSNRKNWVIYNRRFMRRHAAAKHVDRHSCILHNVYAVNPTIPVVLDAWL